MVQKNDPCLDCMSSKIRVSCCMENCRQWSKRRQELPVPLACKYCSDFLNCRPDLNQNK
jgi:hypothetical protein